MNFHHDYPLPAYKEEQFEKYFNVETEWMADEGYAESKEVTLRKVAMHVILRNSKSDKLDAFIPYLAMNIFDRFISRHQLPTVLDHVRDDIVLAANSCLTLAWKMRDNSFSVPEFLMELQILRGLKWQMRAVTPICLVRFFVEMIPIGKGIERRTLNEIIIQTQDNISFTRFRPSVIAASAVLTACRLLYDDIYEENKKILLSRKYVEEEDLETCLDETYEKCIEKKILLLRDVWFVEKPKLEIGAAEIAKAGETSSSGSHRSGKEPIQEQNQDEAEGDIDQEMNFELKWMMWSSDDPEDLTINSPDFRTLPPAPDDPNDGTVEARNYFDLCAPCKSCIIL
ncbi:putative cyclin-D6-1 [Citrus sinensis]|uniref:Cyclin-D6-1 n=1 Tax=Citrus sinensis TaxID=2711 RepID=A0ACB8NZI3_CITSI|nr:putative cyclin-D6-1 [Citrus sinensis]